ncbi:MAG: hypothetical protein ACJAVV_000405 [Alphaproteobacteria bacterium]|jgi:hypothetical protein
MATSAKPINPTIIAPHYIKSLLIILTVPFAINAFNNPHRSDVD